MPKEIKYFKIILAELTGQLCRNSEIKRLTCFNSQNITNNFNSVCAQGSILILSGQMGHYKRVNLFVFYLLLQIVLVLLWETVCFSFLVLVVVAAVQTIIASSFSSLLNRDSNNLVCVCLSDKMGRNLWVFER